MEFTIEVINSIRDGKGGTFRKRYGDVDASGWRSVVIPFTDLSQPKIGALFSERQ